MHKAKPPLDERMHAVLVRAYRLAERDFSHACVERAMAALNRARSGAPLLGEVLWLAAPNAFTLPGRFVYISRRLIERCDSDAPAAFALAHEIAHHDLGHLAHVERWGERLGQFAPVRFSAMLLQSLIQRLYSADNEAAADRYALELCLRAGYDGEACLKLFDILIAYLLDHRDLDGVYGTDDELELDPDRADNPIDWLYIETRLWMARHLRSHPALHDRREALRERLRAAS